MNNFLWNTLNANLLFTSIASLIHQFKLIIPITYTN